MLDNKKFIDRLRFLTRIRKKGINPNQFSIKIKGSNRCFFQ